MYRQEQIVWKVALAPPPLGGATSVAVDHGQLIYPLRFLSQHTRTITLTALGQCPQDRGWSERGRARWPTYRTGALSAAGTVSSGRSGGGAHIRVRRPSREAAREGGLRSGQATPRDSGKREKIVGVMSGNSNTAPMFRLFYCAGLKSKA